MGTRNITAVVLDGEYKVAQYGQWDGYPDGQGRTILEFLKSWNRDEFEAKLRQSSWADEVYYGEMTATIAREGIRDSWQKRWPHISRDAGAKVLDMIEKSESGLRLKNSLSFATDSVFCEWGYVLDLDKGKLEVYRGFNQDPLSEADRFFGTEKEKDASPEYEPIKIVASYDLTLLPTVEEMGKDCFPQEAATD